MSMAAESRSASSMRLATKCASSLAVRAAWTRAHRRELNDDVEESAVRRVRVGLARLELHRGHHGGAADFHQRAAARGAGDADGDGRGARERAAPVGPSALGDELGVVLVRVEPLERRRLHGGPPPSHRRSDPSSGIGRQLGFARELERITRTGANRGGARCGGDVATPAPDTRRVDRRRDDGGAIGPSAVGRRGDAPAGGPSWSIASIASVAPSTSVATDRRAPAPPPPTTTTATAGSAGSRVACIRRPPPPLVDPSRGAPAARLDARRGFAASPTSSSDGTHNPVSSILPRKHFTDAMRAARDAGDVPAVMKHFAELCERTPTRRVRARSRSSSPSPAAEGNPEAVDTLEAMLSLGYPPTHHTHRKIIVAHNRGGQLDRAWEWLQMLAESEGNEYLAHAEGNAGARLFDAILVGAGKVADANVFNECWRVMRSMGVDPTEGTLEAHMLMESKVGWSEGVETAWERRDAGFEYLHPISKAIPEALLSKGRGAREDSDVFAQAEGRPSRREGGGGRGGRWRAGWGRHSRETRRAAWISRAAAAIALDELYARTTPEPATDTAVNGDASSTAVTHPRGRQGRDDDAVQRAYAACGDSDAIRDLMERAQLAGWRPIRTCSTRCFGRRRRIGAWAWDPAEDAGGNAGGGFSVGGSIPAGDVAGNGAGIGYTRGGASGRRHPRRGDDARHARVRGPALHSFMALLAAYAKVGDVAAAGDALCGDEGPGHRAGHVGV